MKRIYKLTTPEKIPAAPTPAMARPTMKTTELGAAPQMADPTSNKMTVARKTVFTEKKVYSLPNINWNEHVVRR